MKQLHEELLGRASSHSVGARWRPSSRVVSGILQGPAHVLVIALAACSLGSGGTDAGTGDLGQTGGDPNTMVSGSGGSRNAGSGRSGAGSTGGSATSGSGGSAGTGGSGGSNDTGPDPSPIDTQGPVKVDTRDGRWRTALDSAVACA